jgi:Arc/MetJ family transcription regulator
VTRPELGPVQALLLGAILGTMTKLDDEEGVLSDVMPVTDEQGFTDTVLATGARGERLVVSVRPASVSPAQERHLRRLAEGDGWTQPKDQRGLPALLALEGLGLAEHPASGWGAWRITHAGRRWLEGRDDDRPGD